MVAINQQVNPCWDTEKQSSIGSWSGRFNGLPTKSHIGVSLPGSWWRVTDNGSLCGFMWMVSILEDPSTVELEACIVSPGEGVGSTALSLVCSALKGQGATTVIATIQHTNPDASKVEKWLLKNGFALIAPPGWTGPNAWRQGLTTTYSRNV